MLKNYKLCHIYLSLRLRYMPQEMSACSSGFGDGEYCVHWCTDSIHKPSVKKSCAKHTADKEDWVEPQTEEE